MSQKEFHDHCVPAWDQHKLAAWFRFADIFSPTTAISVGLSYEQEIFAMKAIESTIEFLQIQGLLKESKNRYCKAEMQKEVSYSAKNYSMIQITMPRHMPVITPSTPEIHFSTSLGIPPSKSTSLLDSVQHQLNS